MTSEGLGDSADTCAGNLALVSMGGRAEGLHAQTKEQGPPLAQAEMLGIFPLFFFFLTAIFKIPDGVVLGF
jgi:hypothetical protein